MRIMLLVAVVLVVCLFVVMACFVLFPYTLYLYTQPTPFLFLLVILLTINCQLSNPIRYHTIFFSSTRIEKERKGENVRFTYRSIHLMYAYTSPSLPFPSPTSTRKKKKKGGEGRGGYNIGTKSLQSLQNLFSHFVRILQCQCRICVLRIRNFVSQGEGRGGREGEEIRRCTSTSNKNPIPGGFFLVLVCDMCRLAWLGLAGLLTSVWMGGWIER